MRARRLLVCAVALLAGLAACSGNDDENASITVPTDDTTTSTSSTSTSTTTSSTTTTDPDQAVRDEVERRYLDQWDAYLEIAGNPDPDHPLIDEFYVDMSRELIRNFTVQKLADGTVTRRPDDAERFSVTVLEVELLDESTARLTACLVDGLVVIDLASDEVLNDNVATKRMDVEMRKVDGAWMHAAATEERLGDGVLPCE